MSRLASFVACVSAACVSTALLVPASAATAPSGAGPVAATGQPAVSASAMPGDREGKHLPTTLATIEVRGTTVEGVLKAQQRLTPGGVSVVDGGTFHARSVTNMADALRYVPGVLIDSSDGGSDGVISIRGSNLSALNYDNSGVALFQDGLPVSTADGNNHNRFVDPLTARAVVVANGANALTYGASTLGGAIDFISRTARNSDPRQLYLLGGSYGLYDGQFSYGGVSDGLDGMLTMAGKAFDGWREHSREHRVTAYGNAGWQVSDRVKLRFFANVIDDREQLAGSLTRAEFDEDPRQADPSYVLGDHQKNVRTRRVAAKGTFDIDADSRLEFGVSYERQSLYHPIVDVYDFRFDPPLNYFSLLIDLDQRTTGGTVRYHHVAGNHNVLAGINLAHTSNTGGNYQNDEGRPGAQTDIIDQQSGNATLFLVDRWTFAPRWTLVYGAQGVITNRDLEDTSLAHDSVRHQRATYNSINPRIGVIRELGEDSEAFASVSRIYAAPTNFDLDNDVRNDNSTLNAMQGTAFEVGTRGTTAVDPGAATWHWSLALYYARLHNEILSVEDPTQPGTMLSTNYDRTIHAGVEGLVDASFPLPGSAIHIEPLVSITWNHFRFHHDPAFGDNQLPYAPDYVVHGEIMVRNRQTGFYAGPTFDIAGSRFADMANTYRVDGHGVIGLRAGIERDNWNLFAEVRNLTDKDYVSDVSVLTQASPDARVLNPGAPRSIHVGLQVHY